MLIHSVFLTTLGYDYARGNESLDKMLFCAQAFIISEVSLETYDEDTKQFARGLDRLGRSTRKQIYDIMRLK